MSLDEISKQLYPVNWTKLLRYLRNLEREVEFIRDKIIGNKIEVIEHIDRHARDEIEELCRRITFLEGCFAEIETESKFILRRELEKAEYPEREIKRILEVRQRGT